MHAPDWVADELAALASRSASGALQVSGEPGGTIYLSDGCLAFAESPGVPDLGSRLVNSRRLGVDQWRQANRDGHPDACAGDLLMRRGLIDEAEWQALLQSAALDALVGLARSQVARRAAPRARSTASSATIAVARDPAFQFYYPDNLQALERAGARLAFWSPIADRALPEADGLYIGGGYPELYGHELAANVAMREAVRTFARSGRPVYAECGGLMYLAESLTDLDGHVWPMAGVLPAAVVMERGRLVIGYREVTLTSAGPLGPAGTRARGHEFHCSRLEDIPAPLARLYAVTDGRGGTPRAEGFVIDGALLSYVHLHFGSNPALAANFVAACRR